MKARVYEEVDVTEWLSGQVRVGCTRVNLQSHVDGVERCVRGWALSRTTDLAGLTEEIRVASKTAREMGRGLVVFGLFSYRPERWTHVEVALFIDGASQ